MRSASSSRPMNRVRWNGSAPTDERRGATTRAAGRSGTVDAGPPRQRGDQLGDVGPPAPVGHDQGLPAGEPGERRRELGGRRHLGVVDEHRDHPGPAAEGELELAPHEVPGPVDAPAAFVVGGRQPVRPDDAEHDVGGGDRVDDDPLVVRTDLGRLHVHEHLGGAEVGAEGVVQAAGVRGRVLTSVADEDPRRIRSTSAAACRAGPPRQPTRPLQFRELRSTSLNGLVVSKLGSRGRPSTRSPMPLRCISLVPAAMAICRPLR